MTASPPLLDSDDQARALAHSLLDEVSLGSLATFEVETRAPMATLTTVACDDDRTPIILISALAGHTRALRADPRCSLLMARPGAGDPLAHPRLTVQAHAAFLDRERDDGRRARQRFLERHPKAALYADFADFSFVRLEMTHGWLNAGFGRAFRLERMELIRP